VIVAINVYYADNGPTARTHVVEPQKATLWHIVSIGNDGLQVAGEQAGALEARTLHASAGDDTHPPRLCTKGTLQQRHQIGAQPAT
jgi:hypothetical protein